MTLGLISGLLSNKLGGGYNNQVQTQPQIQTYTQDSKNQVDINSLAATFNNVYQNGFNAGSAQNNKTTVNNTINGSSHPQQNHVNYNNHMFGGNSNKGVIPNLVSGINSGSTSGIGSMGGSSGGGHTHGMGGSTGSIGGSGYPHGAGGSTGSTGGSSSSGHTHGSGSSTGGGYTHGISGSNSSGHTHSTGHTGSTGGSSGSGHTHGTGGSNGATGGGTGSMGSSGSGGLLGGLLGAKLNLLSGLLGGGQGSSGGGGMVGNLLSGIKGGGGGSGNMLGSIATAPLGLFSNLVGHDSAAKAAANGDVGGWLVNTFDHSGHSHALGGASSQGSSAPLAILGTAGQELGGLIGIDKVLGSAQAYDAQNGTNYAAGGSSQYGLLGGLNPLNQWR